MRQVGILASCAIIVLTVSACHPWFKMGPGAPEDQVPEITSPDGTPPGYMPGTPPWVPLIDACMSEGRSRGDCIESLPPDTLSALEEWERANGELRRTQLRYRQALDGFGFTTDDYLGLTQPQEPAEE